MKEYNRKTKRWEEPEKNSSLKKPDTCKGKKPHDFVLLVPKWIKCSHYLSKDEISEYYRLEDERNNMNNQFDLQFSVLGIENRVYYGPRSRFYRCSVCGKEDYK